MKIRTGNFFFAFSYVEQICFNRLQKKSTQGPTINYWWRSGLHCGPQIWPETYIWIRKTSQCPNWLETNQLAFTIVFKELNEGLQLDGIWTQGDQVESKRSKPPQCQSPSFNNKQFTLYQRFLNEAEHYMNNYADRGGCYPPIVWGNIPSYR